MCKAQILAEKALRIADTQGEKAMLDFVSANANPLQWSAEPDTAPRCVRLQDGTMVSRSGGAFSFHWTDPSGAKHFQERETSVQTTALPTAFRPPISPYNWPPFEEVHEAVLNTIAQQAKEKNGLPEYAMTPSPEPHDLSLSPSLAGAIDRSLSEHVATDRLINAMTAELDRYARRVINQLPQNEYDALANRAAKSADANRD